MFLLHSYLTFVIKSNTHFNTHAGPIESIMYNCINYMESNRCKSIYLAEIQSLCISGGIWIVHQSQTLTWQQYKTYQITKGCQIGCFLSTLAQLFLAYSIISRARSGFGRIHSFSQRSLTRICICVFVRQIKVWAGLLVLAKVSNQNCHKSQVAPRCLPARWQIVENEKF